MYGTIVDTCIETFSQILKFYKKYNYMTVFSYLRKPPFLIIHMIVLKICSM